MDLEDMVIAIFVIGIVTTATVMIVGGFSSISNTTIDTTYASSFNKISDEMTQVNQTKSKLFEGGANPAFSLIPIITSLLSIGSILLDSVGIINQMLQTLALYTGIPVIIITALTGIVTIMFLFALIRLFIGRNRT